MNEPPNSPWFPLLPLAGEGARSADEGVLRKMGTDSGRGCDNRTNTLTRPIGHPLPQAGEGENWRETH